SLKDKFELSFILLNSMPSAFERFLQKEGVLVYTVRYRGKKDFFNSFFKVLRLLRKIKPQIVHTHFFDANNLGLLAARFANIPTRIYTRHHSSLHHTDFKKGIWFDRLANSLATYIVSISNVVTDILVNWEKVPRKKVIYIPHGIKIEDFRS